MVAFLGGESMRSPEGGSILRGAGGAVEEGSMVHALRGLMLRREDCFLFFVSPSVNCEGVGVKIDTESGKWGKKRNEKKRRG